ncbi:type II toxin-antitoxin system RelE/ParE family toxin [Actinobacillus equuli]|uniref:type II toxin-antitoxin system RelE/ParE family toxin n=1 Tax=Actinobacillus equuli TaxID=718 RepID=UPI0024421294|nr:type II toxin-antitoxin system RelE/ParE family toxin [Actinobacillus equuli]WGE58949.1 type II toxin-antitoxin system RelE/ParE family toxin [Actinobacillus equuli subsp. haemolyticus]WGE60453.1 type II toxin-antitoxin system RelE/ParE family toxin [Actinobacillus equuli subsp. haemolyticus]WGE71593.1 type II toxin-antitoxin system RelE/ParE family toxin [Actinobacillus equuli subsp. haemolyticus]WGE75188.1 type II toxin-antitoxin system RelE/ParE family toxin [Actinobacillus equuli subsp. 
MRNIEHKWEIILYQKENGEVPVAHFLDNLSLKLQAKAYRDIDTLSELGSELRMPYSKAMKEGIFELRISQSNAAARIFYFFRIGRKVILTNGFIKKTQKTPSAELQKALEYKRDYERRME